MWDAILEYRMLSAPLAVKDVQEDLQEAMKEETGKVSEDAAASAGGSPLSAHEAGTRGQLGQLGQGVLTNDVSTDQLHGGIVVRHLLPQDGAGEH